MPVRISVASEGEEEETRDLRASSSPNSPTKALPYSSILAGRREEAARAAAAKARPTSSRGPSRREHGWSSTSLEDTQSRTKSSLGNSTNKIRKLSPRALMRKYRSKMKPRTFLLLVFASVSLIILIFTPRPLLQAASIHKAYTKQHCTRYSCCAPVDAAQVCTMINNATFIKRDCTN